MRRGPNTAYSSVWQTSAFFVIRLCWVCIYVEKHEHYRRLCMVSTRPFGVGEHVVAISLFHGSVSECSIGCGSESQFCSCCADWLCRIILIVCLTDRFVVDFFAFRSLSASPSSGSVIQGMGWGGLFEFVGQVWWGIQIDVLRWRICRCRRLLRSLYCRLFCLSYLFLL